MTLNWIEISSDDNLLDSDEIKPDYDLYRWMITISSDAILSSFLKQKVRQFLGRKSKLERQHFCQNAER